MATAEEEVRETCRALVAGERDAFELCEQIVGRVLHFADGTRGTNLYLVWINFIDCWTTQEGGEEVARGAMPAAAQEWLASEGTPEDEQAYFKRWFEFHTLEVEPERP